MAWVRRHVGKDGRVLWYVEWRDPATKSIHTRPLGPVSEEAARAQAAEASRAREGRRPKAEPCSPGAAVERFLAGLTTRGRSPATVRFYRQKMEHLQAAFDGTPIEKWEPGRLEAYLAARLAGKPPWAPRTAQMLVIAARTFEKWCRRRGGVRCPAFTEGIESPELTTPEAEALSREQVTRLLDAARDSRLEVPIAMAVLAGLSLGDLRAVTWGENVRLDHGVILGKRRKTGIAYRVTICDTLREVLVRHRATHGPVCRGIPTDDRNLATALNRIQRRARVGEGGWHRLRHTYGSMLGATVRDLATIREAMGHALTSRETLRYLHTDSTRSQAAAAAIDRALRGA